MRQLFWLFQSVYYHNHNVYIECKKLKDGKVDFGVLKGIRQPVQMCSWVGLWSIAAKPFYPQRSQFEGHNRGSYQGAFCFFKKRWVPATMFSKRSDQQHYKGNCHKNCWDCFRCTFLNLGIKEKMNCKSWSFWAQTQQVCLGARCQVSRYTAGLHGQRRLSRSFLTRSVQFCKLATGCVYRLIGSTNSIWPS